MDRATRSSFNEMETPQQGEFSISLLHSNNNKQPPAAKREFSEVYQITRPNISDRYSSLAVYMEATEKATGELVDVKSIFRDRYNGKYDVLEREIEILSSLDHPRIQRFREYLIDEDTNILNLIFDHVDYVNVAEYVRTHARPEETTIQVVIREIVLTLNYLWKEKKIMHRNISPRSITFNFEARNEKELKDSIKFVDFAMAHREESDNVFHSCVGTSMFQAPELYYRKEKGWITNVTRKAKTKKERSYTYLADVWSVGMLTYMLLSKGDLPFNIGQSSPKEALKEWRKQLKSFKMTTGRFKNNFKKISPQAKTFIKNCLEHDPSKRPSYDDLLEKNEWLQEGFIPNEEY